MTVKRRGFHDGAGVTLLSRRGRSVGRLLTFLVVMTWGGDALASSRHWMAPLARAVWAKMSVTPELSEPAVGDLFMAGEGTFQAGEGWGRATPVFLPGESQGRGSLMACCLWSRTESDTTEVTQQQQQK